MSHGDSPDGFVFPPFIPPSAARPPAPPPAESPAPAKRPLMPWDLETPIVADSAAPAAPPAAEPVPAAPAEEPAGEDLPWLELPEPAAAAMEPAAAETDDEDEEFPEWLTWDARAEADAEAELMGTPPLEGMEEFAPAEDFAAEEPAPSASAEGADAVPFAEEDAFLYGELPAPETAEEESPRIADIADLELEPGYGFAPEQEEETGYAAPAEAPRGFAPEASEDPFARPEPESEASAPAPFVADDEAVMASEPDPFTLAEIDATEAEEPAEGAETGAPQAAAGGESAFDEVAARLEEIARMLRERPDELLAGRGDDPLALLVTGYVMGYGHGRRG